MPRLRIRGPNGMSAVALSDHATVADLLSQITEKTSLSKFEVKYGYPPKPLLLPESKTTLLSSLGVSLNGEQLIISSLEDSPPATNPPISVSGKSHETGRPLTCSRIPSLQVTPREPSPKKVDRFL